MQRARLVLIALLFAGLLAPIAWAVYSEARIQNATDLLQPILDAEESIPVQGDRAVISWRDDVKLESISRVYMDPPDRRKVVFKKFLRNGEEAEPGKWWKGFFRGGKTSSNNGGKKKPDLFSRMASMAGWSLPRIGRMFFSKKTRKFQDIKLVARNYHVRHGGAASIAGRAAYVIDLLPKYEGRPAYRIWADQENHFPLRFQVHQGGAHPAFESAFQSITYHPEFPEKIFEKKKGSNAFLKMFGLEIESTTIREAAKQLDFQVWAPSRLPGGVAVLETDIIRARIPAMFTPEKKGKPLPISVFHATYTDGAAVATVINISSSNPFWLWLKPMLLKEHGKAVSTGKQRVYRITHRAGTALILEREGTVVAVAGNFPYDELLYMVKSLRRKP